MSKSKALIAAELRIAELEAKVLALEAKVSIARTCYRALRDSVRVVAHAPIAPRITSAPTVTRWNDALGREWIKTRTGNLATSRLAIETIAQ